MKKKFTRKRKIIIYALLAVIIFLLIACDCRLAVRKYEIDSSEADSSLRIAFVSDLHSCYYGKNQKNLIDSLLAEEPDLLLLGGDIFDDKLDDKNTELFIRGVSGKFPIYYVTGNHEHWAGESALAEKLAILEKHGVTVLSNEYERIEIKGQTITVVGLTDLSAYTSSERENTFFAQLDALNKETKSDGFTVLLSHRPEYFEKYVTYDFDLVLSGHAHGGQWRIPLILNGLYAPNQGLFPKYAGGRYDENGRTMIVSRGLARESTPVPRIFNRPELVIIEIK